jgi:hypothetical protein
MNNKRFMMLCLSLAALVTTGCGLLGGGGGSTTPSPTPRLLAAPFSLSMPKRTR